MWCRCRGMIAGQSESVPLTLCPARVLETGTQTCTWTYPSPDLDAGVCGCVPQVRESTHAHKVSDDIDVSTPYIQSAGFLFFFGHQHDASHDHEPDIGDDNARRLGLKLPRM